MYCSKCGKKNEKESVFCIYCGKQMIEDEKIASIKESYSSSTNPLAIAGFVVGLMSSILNFFGITGIIAIILSSVALSQIKRDNSRGKGFAVAGLVTGATSVFMLLAVIIFATTNNDKFEIVSELFKRTIFNENEYEILKLTKDMNVPDEKESGNNIERARTKALNAYSYLKDYNFDFIVGLDDAIVIKGKTEPNIKEYLNKIIYENYLEDGEEYALNRAYCIVDKDKNIFETNIDIPYQYRKLDHDINLREYGYPLSLVSCPIGSNIPLTELTFEEDIEYYKTAINLIQNVFKKKYR